MNISPPSNVSSGFAAQLRSAQASQSARKDVSPESTRRTEALLPKALDRVEKSGTAQPPSRVSAEEVQQQLQEAAQRANSYLEVTDTGLRFEVGKRTGRIIVTVVDRETDEVIRQIPTEEMVRISERMNELRGLLFDAEG